MLSIPAPVTICDVTMRDGLQSEKEFIPTEKKLAIYRALLAAGVRHFEIGAFVSPRFIPQMSDAEAVVTQAPKPAGVMFQALVPNAVGARRALDTPVDELIFLTTASESYTRKNQNRTIDQVFSELDQVVDLARPRGLRVRVGIGMSFCCPYEGPTPVDQVLRMVERSLKAGAQAVQVADSIGTATPSQVQALFRALYGRWPNLDCGLHLHDNRGQALVNALAGLDAGCRHLDACLGGLGGTPVYAGSMGNLCLEDLVYMLQGMGAAHDIDLEVLLAAARLAEETVGRPLPSKTYRAGIRPAI